MQILNIESLPNPFEGLVYISNKSVNPDEIFTRYSVIPFAALMQEMRERINYFIIGRTGIGKSMILTLFDNIFQKTIFTTSSHQPDELEDIRIEIKKRFPTRVLAIYTSLLIDSYIDNFTGRKINNPTWRRYFGDYFGHRLLLKLICLIEELKDNQSWRDQCGIKQYNERIFDEIAFSFGQSFGELIYEALDIKNWISLKEYISLRLMQWRRQVKTLGFENFRPYQIIVDLIDPCKFFIQILKEKGFIEKDCRLFIIIDQYESLWDRRATSDFRPVFNQAMEQVSKSGIPIEFKISVRPYAWQDNLQISENSDNKIQYKRNFDKIELDSLAENYFNRFIEDLSSRCLNKYPEFKSISIKSILKPISPIEEIKFYCGSSELKNQHLTRFFNGNPDKPQIEIILHNKIKVFDNPYCKIWFETLMGLSIESKLKKNVLDLQQLEKYVNEVFNLLMDEMKSICESCNKDCICYQSPKYEGIEKKTYRKLYEYRNKALFIIVTAFKARTKIYSGFEEILRVSSKTALNYVLIMLEIFNQTRVFREKDKNFLPIPPKIQSDSILAISDQYYSNIPYEAPHGLIVHRFLKNIGRYFRDKQIDPKDSQKNPNRLSFDTKLELMFDKYKKLTINPMFDYSELLQEILSFRYLEKSEHTDRSLPGFDRNKYSLNLLLCPKFNLTTLDHGPPQYIKQEKAFITESFKESCRNLKRFEKMPKKNEIQVDWKQTTLF